MDATALNTLDYIVIGIVLVSTFFAFIRGFIGSFLSLTGWILSIYLSYLLFPQAQPFLEEKTKNPLLVLIFGHSILLLGFLIVFGIFNLVATTAVKGLTKGIIDRILGAGFGILRGSIIVSFFFLLYASSVAIFQGSNVDGEVKVDEDTTPKWLKSAQTYPMLKQGQNMLKEVIPNSFYERLQVVYDTVSKKTMDERFVENTMKKLSRTLSKDQKEQLEKEKNEDILTMSGEEVENKKLSELLKIYNESDAKDKPQMSKQEMHRLENLLAKSMESVKSSKEVEPVELNDDVLP